MTPGKTVRCERCNGKGVIVTLSPAYLRQLRKAAGVSLRNLGARCGVTASYLCDIELSRRPLRHDSRIATAYLALR